MTLTRRHGVLLLLAGVVLAAAAALDAVVDRDATGAIIKTIASVNLLLCGAAIMRGAAR